MPHGVPHGVPHGAPDGMPQGAPHGTPLAPLSPAGGSPGALGLNLLLRRDGRAINLGAKTSVPVQPGDVFCLQTPGGGGFGPPGDAGDAEDGAEPPAPRSFAERGSLFEYRRAQEAV